MVRPRRTPGRMGVAIALAGLAVVAVLAVRFGRGRLGSGERWRVTHLLPAAQDDFDQAALYGETEVGRLSFRSGAEAAGWTLADGSPLAGASPGAVRLSGGRATQRIFGPFGQEARAIDVVEVEVEQERPSPVALFWPRPDGRFATDHGQARLPGPRGVARFTLASHPLWQGRIERIAVQPSFGAQTVLLRGIRFLAYRLDPERAAVATRDVRTVELGGDSRPALPVATGRPASIEVEVPKGARLAFDLGLPEHVAASADFVLGVSASAGGGDLQVPFSVRHGRREASWSEHEVDLGAFAGRKVTLSLKIEPGVPDPSPIGFWGNPRLRWPAPREDRPNVLLISADTLRADHLSLYGYARPTSPQLASWAERRGVVFRNTVAPAPWTLPSHVSLFTGVDAHRHGVLRQGPIPPALPVLAEQFRAAGYLTLASTGGGLVDARFGFARGFDVYRSRGTSPGNGSRSELEQGVEETLGWLERHAREPFFLFFHTYAVHTPLQAREPFLSRVRGRAGPFPDDPLNAEGLPLEASDGFRKRYRFVWSKPLPEGGPARPASPGPAAATPGVDRDDPQWAIDFYDSAIAGLDAGLGTVLERLRVLGLEDKTIVVFTSDHGESLGENGLWAHTHLQDSNLMIPLVVSPRPRSAPRSVDPQVRLIDVAPTLLEMAGLAVPPTVNGRSLVPLLSGATRAHPDEAWSYASRTNWGLGLRVANRWKLIVPNTIWPALRGRDVLYDLAADPRETADAAPRPPYEALRARANRELSGIGQGVVVTARCDRGPCFTGVLGGLGRERDTLSSPDLTCACVEPVPEGTRLSLHAGDSFRIVYEDVAEGELDLDFRAASPPLSTHLTRRVGPGQAPFALRLEASGWRVEENPAQVPEVGLHVSYRGPIAKARPAISQEMQDRLRALGYIQ